MPRICLRNDFSYKFSETNPVLLKGEIGIATDLNNFKIGDGDHTWNDLPFVLLGKNICEKISKYISIYDGSIKIKYFKVNLPIAIFSNISSFSDIDEKEKYAFLSTLIKSKNIIILFDTYRSFKNSIDIILSEYSKELRKINIYIICEETLTAFGVCQFLNVCKELKLNNIWFSHNGMSFRKSKSYLKNIYDKNEYAASIYDIQTENEGVKNMKGIANTYVTKINREDTELNNLKYFFQTNVKTRKLYICFDSAEMLNKSTDIIFEYLCKKEYKNKKIYIMCEETCKLSEIMEFFAVCYTSRNKNIRFAIDGRFKFTKIKNLLK